jgi:3-isopropylmalate/(R)-2-methylmalate dehydratase small subunit
MIPFDCLAGIAAPLPIRNVDTDKILPAAFLTTVTRTGLGKGLFAELRKDPQFVLNNPPWDEARILVAFDNFGCGSSREHAPWALLDFGIRCIIAPSFADIFYNNCFKNGILPIILPAETVGVLMGKASAAATARMNVDLPRQVITAGDAAFGFSIDPRRKQDLMLGLDEIQVSLERLGRIEDYERTRVSREPWLREITFSDKA